MHLLQLPAVLHGGEVHGVDVNSSGDRLATCGKDHAVCVWLLLHLDSPTAPDGTLRPWLPTHTLAMHTACVRIVRWSPTDPDTVALGDAAGNVYVSRVGGALLKIYPPPHAATREVVDALWSRDGRLLVWSAGDGTVHLYDHEQRTHQQISTAHEKATVQRSVAFSPTDNTLVAVDDDAFVLVYAYAYASGYQVRNVARVLRLMGASTPVVGNDECRRIAWSPDGEFFAVPTASKQLAALISLVSRAADWDNAVALVGHDLRCNVVRFCPFIFQGAPLQDGHAMYQVVASAGADRTLALWNTSKELPIAVLREAAARAIVDMAWDRRGHRLIVASLDGHLSLVTFDPDELGTPAHPADMARLSVLQTRLQQLKPDESPKKGKDVVVDQKDATPLDTLFKETQPPPPPAHVAEAPQAAEPAVEAEVEPVVLAAAAPGTVTEDMLGTAMARPRPKKAKAKAPVVTVRNGKKRVQPTLVTASAPPPPVPHEERRTTMEFAAPSAAVTDELRKAKRARPDDKRPRRELEAVRFVGLVVANPLTACAKVRLAVPRTRMGFQLARGELVVDVRNGLGNETTPSRITMFKRELQIWCDFVPRYVHLGAAGELYWALATADGQVLTYHLLSGRRYLPPLVLGSPVACLESHGRFLLAVTAVGELFVWDMDRRALHMLAPQSLGALLDLHSKPQDDVLSKGESLTMCSVTSHGIPLVTLSNGLGFLYNQAMGTWQTVTEAWWAFGSHYWDSVDKGSETSIVGLLEHKTNESILRRSRLGRGKYFSKILKNMVMKEGFENLENTILLAHMENRILCCEMLGERSDLKRFLVTYAKRVCELGLKAKLYALCQELWDNNSDKTLLQEIIVMCAPHRDAQRILAHFGQKLGLVSADY